MSVSKGLGYILERLAQPAFSVQIDAGLSDAEVQEIEARYAIIFPPDLRALFSIGLPVGSVAPEPPREGEYRGATPSEFPNWRHRDETKIRERLTWPLESALFDVRVANFWLRTWPARPESLDGALAVASEQIAKVAPLVPIYAHRYIPSIPDEARNPVFSVYQTDVIYYGADLEDYFEDEFFDQQNTFHKAGGTRLKKTRFVPFWSDLAYGLNG